MVPIMAILCHNSSKETFVAIYKGFLELPGDAAKMLNLPGVRFETDYREIGAAKAT
jgi:hypothetical protein